MSELGVLDALPDGVVVADGNGSVVELNRTARAMLGGGDVGAPLEAVLLLQDQDGNTWSTHNAPYRGLSTRTGVPEQAWTLPERPGGAGHRPDPPAHAPATRSTWSRSRCAPAAAGPGSTASAPTWSPPSPTRSARR